MVLSLAAAQAADGQVRFQNETSETLSIVMDGLSICALYPGASCTAPAGGDPAQDHAVRVEAPTRTYDDSFNIDECYGVGADTFVYYIRNDDISVDCD